MLNTNLSFSVLTANLISLLLLFTLYLGNRQRMENDRDMHIVTRMMLITAVSNIADTCVFYLDGTAGIFPEAIVLISGSWLYLANVLIGYTCSRFIMTHLNIPFTEKRKRIYLLGGCTAVVLLVINLFSPVVFSVRNGIYQRGPLYIIFLVFALLYIIDSLYMYIKCRKNSASCNI